MENKMVRVPFDVEMAKKITNGEVEGRVVTRDGRSARVVCWDKKSDSIYNIVGLIDGNIMEIMLTYTTNGYEVQEEERNNDLMLEIPEYMTFKDGDILICECGTPFIYKDTKDRHGNFSAYCGIDLQGTIFFDMKGWTYSIKGYANKEQKKIIIDALKASKEPKAKEYIKRFFDIEVKPECEFKPFEKVMVRDADGVWFADIFSHYSNSSEFKYKTAGGGSWECCIPYNEQTAHLLGTDKDWEE